MTARDQIEKLLAAVEACRQRYGPLEIPRVVYLLNKLDRARFDDARSLIRFHEALLFLRAFPQGPEVVRAAEGILDHFHKKIDTLRAGGCDMDEFEPIEVSGIAGTTMEDTLSFDVARWLVQRLTRQVEIAWEHYEPGRELGNVGPSFIPLLGDDAYVEADTPWRQWLEAAVGKSEAGSAPKKPARTLDTIVWLIACFDRMELPAADKAALYDSLRVPVRWNLANSRISRTRNWKPVRRFFYHSEPLISRSQVSLARELARPRPVLVRLSLRRGQQVMDMIREVMLVRYRELYGTTLGDPRSVVRARVGRGVEIYLWTLPPDRRLPLRAYVAGLTLKNGVPINYIEAIGLCEWMEVGFNTFYTFRGGEAAWVYAQVLRCLCTLMETTVISVYPYQLGHENDEAIESGAFWFYRKLGFRPGRPDLQRLAQREEKKIVADPKYRTPARMLKRLAAGHVFYELPGSQVGAWDGFSTRNIGLRVNRRMARDFGGDTDLRRQQTRRAMERELRVSTASWAPLERAAFENFALVLAQPAELRGWARKEKEDLIRLMRSKADADEMRYLHHTQRHPRLRKVLLALGS